MRKLISVLAIITGILAILTGILVGVLAFWWLGRIAGPGGSLNGAGGLAGGLQNAARLQNQTVGAIVVLLSLAGGVVLTWAGWRGYRGGPANGLRLPGWGWFLLATLVTLAAGQAAFALHLTGFIPFLHVVASVLPPLLFLSLVAGVAGHRGRTVSARAAAGSLGWGGLGAVGLAMTIELVVFGAVGVALFLWIQSTQPGILEELRAWAQRLPAAGGRPTDLGPLTQLLLSPWVVLSLLGLVGVATPMIEEAMKGLAVPLVAATGRRLTRLDGFLLGVAAGAGFAAFESPFYGAMALSAPNTWGGVLLLRGATATIHCFASGLVGLGWQAILTERRWLRGIGLGLLGAAVHGAWNMAAAGQMLVGLSGSPATPAMTGDLPLTLGSVAFVLILGLLWLAALIAMPAIASTLAWSQPGVSADGGAPGPGSEAATTAAIPEAAFAEHPAGAPDD